LVIENSTLIRNQTLQTLYPASVLNFRGLVLSFAQKIVFINNHMETLNPGNYQFCCRDFNNYYFLIICNWLLLIVNKYANVYFILI
jgi:hypothetical protein